MNDKSNNENHTSNINDEVIVKNPDRKAINPESKQLTIGTCIITSIVTVTIALGAFAFWLQKPLANIQANQQFIEQQNQETTQIKEALRISRIELEAQVRAYIDENYGVLSERDEKIDKLLIYFKQQDARLSNIEKALSKF